MVADLLHGLGTVLQEGTGAAAGDGGAHQGSVLDLEAGQVVAGGHLRFEFLGQGVADTGPHVLSGGIGDDGGVHEGMNGAAGRIVQVAHGAVGIVHDAQGGAGGAVGSQGGEGEDGLVQVAGSALGGIQRTAAADAEDDVGVLDLRHSLQHGGILIGSLTAEPDGLAQLQVSAVQDLLQFGNSDGHSSLAADDSDLLAIGADDVINLVIAVGTDAPGGQVESAHDNVPPQNIKINVCKK